MERRNFIKSSLGIGLGATLPGMTHSKSGKEAETAVSPAMPVKSGKPHIILIMTDQQRGDALGCMGNKAVISPNIDRLAQEGSLFVSGTGRFIDRDVSLASWYAGIRTHGLEVSLRDASDDAESGVLYLRDR